MNLIKNKGYKKQTFLCAKYDYKMDIAVKKEEAFQDGQEAKAEEVVKKALAINLPPEQVSHISGLSLEKVLALQEK